MIFRVRIASVRMFSLWVCSAIVFALARPAAAAPTRKVVIDTDPSGASVYVGEKEAGVSGVTPVTLDLPVGDNVVIIELDNFVPKFETVTVPKGKGKPVKVTFKLERGVGALVFTTDAASKGARVLIDDEEAGTAPGRIEVPAGMHRVAVIAKGKTLFDEDLIVGAGAEEAVIVRAPKAAAGAGMVSKGGKDGGKDGKGAKGGKAKGGKAVAAREEEGDGGRGEERDGDGDGGKGATGKAEAGDEGGREPPSDDVRTRAADGEPTEVAFRDDEEPGGRAEVEVRGEVEVARPARPAGPPRYRVAPFVELGYRYLDYDDVETGNLPALRQRGTVLFGARVEVQPLRSLPGLKVMAAGGHGLPQVLTTSRGEADAIWWRGEAEASYRIGLGKRWGVSALGGYGMSRFKFNGQGGSEALVPAAFYNVVRLGAGVGFRHDRLEALLQVENRPVLSGGKFTDRFQSASADGLAARLTLASTFRWFFARLDGNYARYAWRFSSDQDDIYRADGATDVQFGFSFAAGATF
jgi:hypothetical protein